MENRKGIMPGTRPTKRDSAAFPTNGDYHEGARSGRRAEAMREGKGDKQTLTRAERLHRASDRATAGPAGFHGVKHGKDVLASRPRASTPTRHPGNLRPKKH
ncbi:hypothetical protein [Vulgatibacter sp.]|uniref:hypothetical protein n=1 Tax=Vulgatibacter sp. TaxID=1971226 RepID=UPI00356570D4